MTTDSTAPLEAAGGRRVQLFALLALLLLAAWALHANGLLYAVGAVGTYEGWRFGFTLVLFFLTAAAAAVFPRHRFAIIFGASLLHHVVIFLPLRAAVACAIWVAFYPLVHLRWGWWFKGLAVAGLYAAPFVLLALDPTSVLNGALVVAFCATNFALRSVLYAYEASTRKEEIQSHGLAGYLLCLIVFPLTVVNFAPIGFLVLLRGLRRSADSSMLWRGVKEIGLGVLFLVLFQSGHSTGILPTYSDVAMAADHLDALTAFAACHLLLLKFFLKVAGDIHLAVGMLRVLGFEIPKGTDGPLLARNILEFWRRWNTYYRDFLLALGYYPIAARLRRRPALAVLAGGGAAFLLSGVAHIVQFFVRHPDDMTLRRLIEGQAWALAFGAAVVAWMVYELRRPKAAARGIGAGAPGFAARLRHVTAIALTLSLASLLLLLYYPPLTSSDLSTTVGILRAFLRSPL